MTGYRIISSGNHVTEPVDLWATKGESTLKTEGLTLKVRKTVIFKLYANFWTASF